MQVLGIDIGGSGIKGAPVDTKTGELLAPRLRIPTPEPSKPQKIAQVISQLVQHYEWQGPVGCGFPSVMRSGTALTAANIHKKWVGADAEALFSEESGCAVKVVNDADAAGLAEMTFGAGREHTGVVMIITIGTGLGSALFTQGRLVPNTELGHLEMNGRDAELQASDAARKREKLSWKRWAKRFDQYLCTLERLFWPDLFILGGGVSKQFDQFGPYLSVQAQVTPASMLNEAGIVGAALAVAQEQLS